MFEIVYMKADFEPWWMFEGWEEAIVSRIPCKNREEVEGHLASLLKKLREENDNETVKNNCFYAFWSTKEKTFCEACDDELQIYHGVIVLKENKPFIL